MLNFKLSHYPETPMVDALRMIPYGPQTGTMDFEGVRGESQFSPRTTQ
jgi:hypothetical protein